MMTPKTQTITASTIIALNIAVALALIPMKPDGSAVVICGMIAFVIVWNVVRSASKKIGHEWVQSATRHEILFAIILASLLCLGSISATLAKELGLFDGDLVKRIVGVNMGLMLIVMGNYMPKKRTGSCASGPEKRMKSTSTQRIVAWILVIGGALYALIWLFADLSSAAFAVLFTFPIAILVVFLCRFVYLRVSKNTQKPSPTGTA